MKQIMDNVYLGCLDDIENEEALKLKGVTHVLTVDDRPLSKLHQELFTCLWIHAFDMDETDLLSHFDTCFKFIEEGRASGQVLIHCHRGVSRSATIAIAYVMFKLQMCADDSLALVKKMKSDVRPNPGFMEQLEVFENMGNVIDASNKAYKMYRLGLLARQMQYAKEIQQVPDEYFTADPLVSVGSQNTAETAYKCRKCRRVLFRESAILKHKTGIGEAAFDWRASSVKNEGRSSDGKICILSLFVEPVQWMSGDIVTTQGKLSCPKCNAKLGSFTWTGERCPCGQWITPAFHIQSSKVDQSMPRVLPAHLLPKTTIKNISDQAQGINLQEDNSLQ